MFNKDDDLQEKHLTPMLIRIVAAGAVLLAVGILGFIFFGHYLTG